MKIDPLITKEELEILKEELELLKEVNQKCMQNTPDDEYGHIVGFVLNKIETHLKEREGQSKIDLEKETEFWAYTTLVDNIIGIMFEFQDDDFNEELMDEDSEMEEENSEDIISIQDFIGSKPMGKFPKGKE